VRRRKLHVLVAPFFPENPYQRELEFELRQLGVSVSNATLAADMLDFRRRYRYTRPHILHLHWPDKFCMADSFFGALAKTNGFLRDLEYIREKGTKIVWTIHNLMNHERRHLLIERLLQNWLAKNASAFIAHSKTAKDRAIQRFGLTDKRPFYVIPIGNSIDTYANTLTRAEARAKLGIEPERFVFGYFGRIEEYKGVDDLLKVFGRTPELSDSLLVVAGKSTNDSHGEKVRRLAAALPNVKTEFAHIPDDDVQIYMNAADVVVTPYRHILTSSATMLAMTFGRPIVAPDFPELVASLAPGGAILHRAGDNADLARALIEARRVGAERLEEMGRANFAFAREATWDKIAAKTVKLYLALRKRNVYLSQRPTKPPPPKTPPPPRLPPKSTPTS
jgi:beta-1,4-mannosyltransferase